jgi:glutathione synthase/RimK-type ligase-like ATP-grasp enzyme
MTRTMIALVTAATQPNLCEDDQPLLGALADAGVDFSVVNWDDPAVDWSGFEEVVLRSPWDYPSRPTDFLAWYERVAGQTRVHNAFPIVERNQHKRYLVELAAAGVPVVPTVVITAQEDARRVAREHGWDHAVIKPAIGLGGRSVATFRADTGPAEPPLQGDATQWCVQPYVPSIRTEGEYSVVVIGGVVQHALLKRPGPDDFRVHDGRGGTHRPHPVTDELSRVAGEVLTAFGAQDELIARVDVIRLDDGRPALMELDVTSPCLYTCHNSALAAAFAPAVARLGSAPVAEQRV